MPTSTPFPPPTDSEIVVCLALPGVQREDQIERLRALDSRIRVEILPIDDGGAGAMFAASAADPHAEPPSWAQSVSAQRQRILAETQVLVALYVPEQLDRLAPKLLWVQGVGAGIEQLAKADVRRDRTFVTTASGTSSTSMAEFVVGRLLQIWKHFRQIDERQREHAFERIYGRTFKGTNVGIVGFGNIGRAVARGVNALGAHSIGMRRSEASAEDRELAERFYRPEELHAMLGECDVVVVAAPDTPSTARLIDAKAIAAMRDGAVLVNVARGALVDEAAVIEALESGKLAAAALDVFDREPLPADDPIWSAPNVYISGHSSVSVDRYMDDVFDLFEDNLRRWLAGEELRNLVDMEELGFRLASER